jgi:hypothetical protein
VQGAKDAGLEKAARSASQSKVENGSPSEIILDDFEDLSPLSENDDSTVSITVVGASGDLAKKKIFPALFALYYEDCLPKVCVNMLQTYDIISATLVKSKGEYFSFLAFHYLRICTQQDDRC